MFDYIGPELDVAPLLDPGTDCEDELPSLDGSPMVICPVVALLPAQVEEDVDLAQILAEFGTLPTIVTPIYDPQEEREMPPAGYSCDPSILPEHLRGLLDRTSSDLNDSQRGQLANTLLQFVDLFPVPGSALTGHTDAVEHTIDTGDSGLRAQRIGGHLFAVLRDVCLPRRLNKKKLELRRC